MQQAAKMFLVPTAYYILHTICSLRDIVYRKSQIANRKSLTLGTLAHFKYFRHLL